VVTSLVVPRSCELAAAVVGAVLAGCSFPADYAGTRYQCELGDECPPGYSCIAGYCENGGPPAGDGGGTAADAGEDDGGDGTESDAGQPDAEPPCPAASSFVDEFSSGDNWNVQDDDGCAIEFTLGQVRMSGTDGRCIARTAGQYALDSRVSVEAVKPESGLLETGYAIYLGDVSFMALRVIGGLELLELGDEGEGTIIDTVAFNGTDQRFWAFRAAGDDILFETSPDGVEWTEQGKYRPAAMPACIQIELDAIGIGELAPFTAFDNLNLLPE
jgi:hypothetical protein